jgi:hypothetical protein
MFIENYLYDTCWLGGKICQETLTRVLIIVRYLTIVVILAHLFKQAAAQDASMQLIPPDYQKGK